MSADIRFLCPTCKAVMAAPVERAGKKINCLKCGKRLQIPHAEHAKTTLAPSLGVHEQGDPPRQPVVPSAPPAQVSAPEWFYTKDGKSQLGPFSWAALQALAKSGQVLSTHNVWKQGMSQWAAASTIQGLFANLQSTSKLSPAPIPNHAFASDVIPVSPLRATSLSAKAKALWRRLGKRAKIGVLAGGALLGLFILVMGVRMIGGGASDAERIIGTWAIVSSEGKGMEGFRVKFAGDGTFSVGLGARVKTNGTYKISVTKNPKEIDLVSERLSEGIFLFENGNLKLCLGGEGEKRPTEFEAKRTLVLKRVDEGGGGDGSKNFSSKGLEINYSINSKGAFRGEVGLDITVNGKISGEEKFLLLISDSKGTTRKIAEVSKSDLIVNGSAAFRAYIQKPEPATYVLTLKSYSNEQIVCRKEVPLSYGKLIIGKVHLNSSGLNNHGLRQLDSISISLTNTGEIPATIIGCSFQSRGKEFMAFPSRLGEGSQLPGVIFVPNGSATIVVGHFEPLIDREPTSGEIWGLNRAARGMLEFEGGQICELDNGKLFYSFSDDEKITRNNAGKLFVEFRKKSPVE